MPGYPDIFKGANVALGGAGEDYDVDLISVKFTGSGQGESTGADDSYKSEYATLTIDANGGAGAAAPLFTFTTTIDGTATTQTVDCVTYTTIDTLVTAINALTGFEARKKDCLGTESTATTYFEDLAATWIKEDWVDCFRAIQNGSNTWPVRKRLVNYTFGKTGMITISRIDANATFAAGACNMQIIDDDGNVLHSEALTTATLNTTNWALNPVTYKGPVLVCLVPTTDDISAIGIFQIQYCLKKY